MASSTVFSIAGKGLKFDSAADLEPHIKPLLETSDIYTEVHLGGNTYGVPACEYLAEALRKQTRLSVVKLDDIFATRLLTEIPQALKPLLNALVEIKTLQTIDLSDNAFEYHSQAPLVECLKQHTPLRHLYLSNNGLGPNASLFIAKVIAELADRKEKAREEKVSYEVPPLETIYCGRNRLETRSMEAWAEALRKHKDGLKAIRLQQNAISKEGTVTLLEDGLRYVTGIEVLDLHDNALALVGSTALARALPSFTEIRELGISDCFLTARGFAKIVKALSKGKNTKLEVLRLQFGEIHGGGLTKLVPVVKNALPKLRRVEINGNILDEDDPSISALREILNERKDAAIKAASTDAVINEEEWGLDELDELEDPDSDDEDEEDEDDELEEEDEEEEGWEIIKPAEGAEDAQTEEKPDREVDELTKAFDKTSL